LAFADLYLFTGFSIYHEDTKTPRLQNYPLDAMPDHWHIEMDQKTQLLSGQL